MIRRANDGRNSWNAPALASRTSQHCHMKGSVVDNIDCLLVDYLANMICLLTKLTSRKVEFTAT